VAAREAVARGQVRETQQALAEQKVRLRAAVRRAWVKLALVRQLRQVTAQHIKLVDQFLDVVKVKYQIGKSGQHDYIRLQVLAKKLRDELAAFRRDDRALTASINSALRRPLTTSVKTAKRLSILDAPPNAKALVTLARAQPPRAPTARRGGPDTPRGGTTLGPRGVPRHHRLDRLPAALREHR
jgi:outer membrane protein TolC